MPSVFWSAVVKPGKPVPYVPPPEDVQLHISQAVIAADVPEGKRVSLKIKESDSEVLVATMTAGRVDTVPLDLYVNAYCEFTCLGNYEIHLSGYYSPMDMDDMDGMGDDEDEDEDEDGDDGDDGHGGRIVSMAGLGGGDDDDDEDEDEDDEDEDMDDELAAAMLAQSGLKMANGNGIFGKAKPSVVIKELHGEGDAQDEDDSEDGEDDSEGEEEEEEEEQEQPKPAPKVGSKRTAEQPKAEPHGKKAAAAQPVPSAKSKDNKQAAPATPQPAPVSAAAAAQKAGAKSEQKPAKAKAEAAPAPKTEQKAAKAPAAEPVAESNKNIRRWENGFQIETLSLGPPNGKLAKPGKKVTMRYVGRLKPSGKVFDSTTGKSTFSFRLGVGEVIKGWDLGVDGMREGDKRRLTCPPQLAYGASGAKPTIPPNATLEFDVELVSVK